MNVFTYPITPYESFHVSYNTIWTFSRIL